MDYSIVKLPTQTLRQTSETLHPAQDPKQLAKMLKGMERAMFKHNGVGIAASQVGINQRIFLVNTEQGVEAFFNARITNASLEMLDDEEGCLSVPGVYGMVKRHAWIDIEYDDVKGEHHKIRATDFFARVLQHETDHTNGKLFVDRATSFTRGTPPLEPAKLA